MCLEEEIYLIASWQLPICLLVVILESVQELSEHSLENLMLFPKDSSYSIAIFLNNAVFHIFNLLCVYSMFIMFSLLMKLHYHYICINIVSGILCWLATCYS